MILEHLTCCFSRTSSHFYIFSLNGETNVIYALLTCHRYKIYIEGWAWSVSEKYILACDSMTLYVRPNFYDFFIRGMDPLQHYWPIRENHKCTSLKFAVEWGNKHAEKVNQSLSLEFEYSNM
jgi:hypothetical protein